MQSDLGKRLIISSDGGIMSLITPFQTIVSLAPSILDPTTTITRGGKTTPSNNNGPCQMPPDNLITPQTPRISIQQRLLGSEAGEANLKLLNQEHLNQRKALNN